MEQVVNRPGLNMSSVPGGIQHKTPFMKKKFSLTPALQLHACCMHPLGQQLKVLSIFSR